MSKFYKVLKDTPAYLEGAILRDNGNGYVGTNELFNTEAFQIAIDAASKAGRTFPSAVHETIENSPEWYERVYEVYTKPDTYEYLPKAEALKKAKGTK